MNIPRIHLRSRYFYGAFALLAFALSLRLTFPSEAVKERLIYEAGAHGWQIDIQKVRPSSLMGVRMDGVVLTDASGLRIPVERLDASLQILPLLIGRRVLDYQASIFDGTVEGSAALSGKERRIAMEIEGVDLARALPLRKAAGMDLVGKASGRLDLTVAEGALNRSSGTVELSITGAGLGGGPVAAPPFGTVNIPPLALGTVSAAAKADQGRVAVQKLEAKGGDAEITGEGIAVVLQPRLEFAPLAGQARVRLLPVLWQKPTAAAYRAVVEAGLASARSPDGSYRLQVAGSLGHPLIRPATGGGAPPSLPAPRPAAAAGE